MILDAWLAPAPFAFSISVSCEGSPSVWVSALLRHVYVLRLIHLDSWTAARLADIKGIQSLWTAQVAKVSLNASYYVGWTFTLRTLTLQLVLLVHHSTDVALWTDACEACQSGPLRSAQGAIGPVAHNHQGLLVRVLGIHQLMDIDGYWRSVMPMPKTASEYHLPLLICTIFNYL
jgi:hypothetical protein